MQVPMCCVAFFIIIINYFTLWLSFLSLWSGGDSGDSGLEMK